MGVDPSISQPDLKKRFYVLSKEHHPDLHPDNKQAVQKFQEISESYSVLSNPEKRKRYDRDHLPRFRQQQDYGEQTRGGTYAGSRAPTGLSRRRSAFRGPPPSYFRNGQGGSYDPNVNPQARQSSASSSASSANTGYDYHPGGYAPPGTASADFDSAPVYKTQSQEDVRRNARRAAALAEAQEAAEQEGDFWARFVMVSLVLVAAVTIGTLFVGSTHGPVGKGNSGGLVRGDGTRRKAEEKG
jgi:curved DNA-binding protein CbpA